MTTTSVRFYSTPDEVTGQRKCTLSLSGPCPGPTLAERDHWRLQFGVPAWVFEYAFTEGGTKTVQWEWIEEVWPVGELTAAGLS